MKEKQKQHLKAFSILFLFLFLGYAMIRYSADISTAVYNSIYSCLTVIIPSLFGFLVLSSFLVKSDFYAVISRPFSFISRYVFKIPEEFFSIFLLSLFAGYPVGARLLYELADKKKMRPEEAGRLLCFCYASSPTFILGLVGIQLFSSIKAGLMLYFILVLTNLLMAFIMGLFRKVPPKSTAMHSVQINPQILIHSIESAARSLFQVCIMIIFFAILSAILKSIGCIHFLSGLLSSYFHLNLQEASVIILSFFEISNVSQLPAFCTDYLPVIAGLFSFGGICIIFQVVALTRGKVPLRKFLVVRLLSAGTSGILAYLLFEYFEIGLVLSASSTPSLGIRHISPIPSICLIAMTAILLFKTDTAPLQKKKAQPEHKKQRLL